jgi:hypothetical protein
MKKVLAVLLVIGLLAGGLCAAAGAEETSQENFSVWNIDSSPDPGVTPCGGGGGGGGGGPD